MARYTFPQNRLLAAAPTGGTGLAATNGLLVRVYSDSAATMLADIQTLVGGAIPNSELTVDSTSQLPLFLGPDGVGTLYVRAVAGGPISTINARLDSILPLASDRLTMPSSLSLRVGDKLGVGLVPTRPLDVLAAGQAGFVQSTGTQNNHALTAYQSGNGAGLDNAVAANFPSDNEYASSVYVSGVQQQRATLKITHTKPAVDDSAVNALGIELKGAGTACQGIDVNAPDGATTGNLLRLRNNGRDDFVVKGTGRVGIGVATGATPFGLLDLRPYDASTKGLFTLPAGYRPTGNGHLSFACAANGGYGQITVGAVATGNVRVDNMAGTWIALDDVRFRAEQ